MVQQPAAPPPQPGDRRALADAFDTLVKSEAQRKADEALPPSPPARGLRWFILGALLIGSISVLVLQPAWLFPGPPAPETTQVQEASLRLVIYRDIQRVEAYRRTNGRLPLTVTEAGLPADTRYTVPTVDSYTISESSGPLRLTYKSTVAPADFLGNAYALIRARSRK
ncbi:MAG: hypothetical protein ABJD11_11545 [Gemmatimonadota bacterium]